jgi:anti-sigma-K factor RskA
VAGLAAAVLAVAAATGVAEVRAQHRLSQEQASGHLMAAVLSAPDVVMLTAKMTGGGQATVLMSANLHAVVFAAAGLPPLPASRAYELWLIGPAGSRPEGMLPAGQTKPMVVSGLRAGDRVGVSVEPETGSDRPTTSPVLLLPLHH